MAKANLEITQKLKDDFLAAQDGTIRWLKLSVEGEVITSVRMGKVTPSIESDFNCMSKDVNPDEACFFIFCQDPKRASLQWTLIAFVPESCKVRDKMLYSSSREYLKRQLGQNYFTSEFNATEMSELSFSRWNAFQRNSDEDKPLTESERIKKEHDELECDTSVKSTAMNVVPFHVTENLTAALKQFIACEVNMVEMFVDAERETVERGRAEIVSFNEMPAFIDDETPRYFAYRHKEDSAAPTTFFIFSCPEGAATRLKMLYSTCKATILANTASIGLTFEKTIEIRDRSELAESIQFELSAQEDVQPSTTVFAKPSRPGRAPSRRGRGGR